MGLVCIENDMVIQSLKNRTQQLRAHTALLEAMFDSSWGSYDSIMSTC